MSDGNSIDRRTAVTRMSVAVASAGWPAGLETAAGELERAIRTLKLNGFLVNSHTQNGYLDEQRFWPSRSRTATRSFGLRS